MNVFSVGLNLKDILNKMAIYLSFAFSLLVMLVVTVSCSKELFSSLVFKDKQASHFLPLGGL